MPGQTALSQKPHWQEMHEKPRLIERYHCDTKEDEFYVGTISISEIPSLGLREVRTGQKDRFGYCPVFAKRSEIEEKWIRK